MYEEHALKEITYSFHACTSTISKFLINQKNIFLVYVFVIGSNFIDKFIDNMFMQCL